MNDTPASRPAIADRITGRGVDRTVRELRFQLGAGLFTLGRHAEAIEELQQALKEPGSAPATAAIFVHLAVVQCEAGALEQALVSYIEAVGADPELADEILPFVHRMLTPSAAVGLVRWLEPGALAERASALDLLHMELFRCRLNIYVGRYDAAHGCIERARAASPEHFRAVASELLAPATFEPALLSGKDGNVYLALARIFRLIDLRRALSFTDQALDVGLSDNTDYPEAPAQHLKGEILEALGAPEAASWLFQAGRSYLRRNDNLLSATLLARAQALNPRDPPTYWYWMEALRLLSYAAASPYVDGDRARASLEAWQSGVELAEPDDKHLWVYLSRALLNEQLARLPDSDELSLEWEALAYLERALVQGGNGADVWTYVARFYRDLREPACALHASAKGIECAPADLAAAEERAAVLSEVGDAPAALQAVAKRRELDSGPSAWLDAVEAMNLVLTGPLAKGLELVNQALAAAPNDLWYLGLRANYHRLSERWTEAAADAERIWRQYDAANVGDRERFAWAALELGEVTVARGLFRAELNVPSSTADAHRGLGICALLEGELESAADLLGRSIDESVTVRELDELVALDFHNIRHRAKSWPHGERTLALLANLEVKSEARRADLRRPRSAGAELEEVITKAGSSSSWPRVAATAGLARLRCETGRWVEAAQLYTSLLNERERFPQARLALSKAVDGLTNDSDGQLKGGDPLAAQKGWRSALELVQASMSDDLTRLAALHARLAFAGFLMTDQAETRTHLYQAIRGYRAAGAGPGKDLANVVRPLIQNPTQHWKLQLEWQQAAATPDVPADDRRQLAVARATLVAYLDEAFQLGDATSFSSERVLGVRPIILEVGDLLVPKVDNRQDGGKFLFEDVSAMRERIEDSTGVRMPGLNARPYYSGADHAEAYRIQIDEVPVAVGHVRIGMGYCPTALVVIQSYGIDPAELDPAINPVTGDPGTWVPAQHWDRIRDHGGEIWSETTFIIKHLEGLLRRNLAAFLGLEETETLLAEWRASRGKDGAQLLATTLPDPAARVRFSRLLRRLVKEQVPITALDEILRAAGETGLDDVSRTLRAVRLRVKQQLPGNQPAAVRADVPVEWERLLAGASGEAALAVTSISAVELMAAVRRWTQSMSGQPVLVTRSPELRLVLRLLLEAEFPQLLVLAKEEVLSLDELGQIGSEKPTAKGEANVRA